MMESGSDTDSTPKQQIMPDGIVELVFHYADPWKTHVAGEQPFVQPKSFAISQMPKYIEIESNGRTGFIAALATKPVYVLRFYAHRLVRLIKKRNCVGKNRHGQQTPQSGRSIRATT
jgi:hypothetical protein